MLISGLIIVHKLYETHFYNQIPLQHFIIELNRVYEHNPTAGKLDSGNPLSVNVNLDYQNLHMASDAYSESKYYVIQECLISKSDPRILLKYPGIFLL